MLTCATVPIANDEGSTGSIPDSCTLANAVAE
jgi:hypothetical protein